MFLPHLTDHIALREVCEALSTELVLRALTTIDGLFRGWGITAPRIGVAGLNAHAKGTEDQGEIAPTQDPDALAAFFWIGWEGAVLRAKLERRPEPLRSFADTFFTSILR